MRADHRALPHWMHAAVSHTGVDGEVAFSPCRAGGGVPSYGGADRQSSPRRRDLGRQVGRRYVASSVRRPRHRKLVEVSQGGVDGRVLRHHCIAFFAYVCARTRRSLQRFVERHGVGAGEEADACMIVLMRLPIPHSAPRAGMITNRPFFATADGACHAATRHTRRSGSAGTCRGRGSSACRCGRGERADGSHHARAFDQ